MRMQGLKGFRWTALVIGIALVLPSIRWIVRTQFARQFSDFPWLEDAVSYLGLRDFRVAASPDTRAWLRSAAAPHPNNLNRQIAAASLSDHPLTSFKYLALCFPKSEPVRGDLIRHAIWLPFELNREEAYMIEEERWFEPRPKTAEEESAIAAVIRFAAEGERLDAGNGYFPLMLSAALFAAKRDAEALDALHRAARAWRWDNYIEAELKGRRALTGDAFGERGALALLGLTLGQRFPDHPFVHSGIKVAVYKAMEAEKSGRVRDGISIRRDIRTVGRLIRDGSRSVNHSILGRSIVETSLLRPGGALAKLPDSPGSVHPGIFPLERRVDLFCEFAGRHGFTQDANQAAQEIATNNKVRAIFSAQRNGTLFAGKFMPLFYLWIAGLLLASNLLWMLALGGVASFAKSARAGKSLFKSSWVRAVVFLAAIGVVGVVAFFQALPGQSLASFVTELVAPIIQCLGVEYPAHRVQLVLLHNLWLPLELLFPLVCLLMFAIVSLRNRVPLLVGLSRGFHGLAAPVSLLLAIVYFVILVFTAREESHILGELDRFAENEPWYLAAQVGQSWPVSSTQAGTARLTDDKGCH